MPYPNGTPTPDEHTYTARHYLKASAERPDVADGTRDCLIAIANALLAVAGQLEAIREHGIYRPGDGR